MLTKESHVDDILLITNCDVDSTNSRKITRKKLSPKKEYLAQRVRGVYIIFVCQSEVSFDLSQADQTVEFLPDDIILLNK